MKIKTNELIGPALDWAVAKCERLEIYQIWKDVINVTIERHFISYTPSTSWVQGGPIVDREVLANGLRIGRKTVGALQFSCYAEYQGHMWEQCRMYYGPTPLIAAMRCYVASKLGNEVDVPEELVNE